MKRFCLILLIILPITLFSQSEVKINSFIENDQMDPHIISDNKGNYLIVWTSLNQVNDSSKQDIYIQTIDANLNKTSNEILVNDFTDGEQSRPSAAMNGNGNYVITWASYTDNTSLFDIKAKLYVNGNSVSNEFLVNSTTLNSQTKPSVDIFNDGSFIIVWESWFEDGSDRGIYGQKYFADGTKNSNQFQVNITSKYSQAKPIVKYFPDGKFIVVWESWNQVAQSSSGYDIYGRLYSSNGQSISGEVLINDYTLDYQWYADVLTLDSDNFAVAWCSWEQDGSDGGIYIKKFNTAWESSTGEKLVNSNRKYYQWIPKLTNNPSGDIAVIWSSWLQDGSREGIYAKLFDNKLNEKSFEFRLNDVTESFQWEPSIAAVNDTEIISVWSNYNEAQKNYDILGKRNEIIIKQAVSVKSSYNHPSGISTTSFAVNVVDSSLLTGNTYEISFGKNTENKLYASIKNTITGNITVPQLFVDQGEDIYYLTSIFDGVAVEIKPIYTLEVDFNKSMFVNNSGSNINFTFINPSGKTVVAPIDLAIVWGDASKDQNGKYINPLDSVYSSSVKQDVKTPFRVWDITNNKKLDCYINEPSATKNKQWDPGENIIVLTPEPYRNVFTDFHVQINSAAASGSTNFPVVGDSIYIFTKRPLTTDDVYTFSTSSQYITSVNDKDIIPQEFLLEQNYPNPFNPTTTISFSIANEGIVKLNVYNVLGELIQTLKNEFMQKGNYRIIFNAKSSKLSLSSGVYFYTLESENKFISKKMLLLK